MDRDGETMRTLSNENGNLKGVDQTKIEQIQVKKRKKRNPNKKRGISAIISSSI